MTKREICSRLFGVIGLIDNSHDDLLRVGINIVIPYTMAKEMLQNLVLDIASSDGELLGEIQESYFPRKEKKNEKR